MRCLGVDKLVGIPTHHQNRQGWRDLMQIAQEVPATLLWILVEIQIQQGKINFLAQVLAQCLGGIRRHNNVQVSNRNTWASASRTEASSSTTRIVCFSVSKTESYYQGVCQSADVDGRTYSDS